MGTIYISRSQARRVLQRLENFKKIILDFDKVPTIGQAFADEVFSRLYHHPPRDRNHPRKHEQDSRIHGEKSRKIITTSPGANRCFPYYNANGSWRSSLLDCA